MARHHEEKYEDEAYDERGIDETDEEGVLADDAPRLRRRWLRWMLVALVLFGVGIWFLPTLIAVTPLRQQIIALALPGINGSAMIGSASLGWLSPVELQAVELRDAAGAPIVSIGSITTKRSLWQLATDRGDLGDIRIERLAATLVLRPDGSNLEDVLNPLLNAPSSDAPMPAMTIVVVDGRASLSSASKPQDTPTAHGSLEKIEATLRHVPGAEAPLTVNAGCNVLSEGSNSAAPLGAELKFKLDSTTGQFAADHGSLVVKSTAVDLAALRPLAVRLVPSCGVDGVATANLAAEWGRDNAGTTLLLSGTAEAERLAIAAPELLGPETLHVDLLRVTPDVALAGGRVQLKACRLESELLSVTASGNLATSLLAIADAKAALAGLSGEDFELAAQLDMALLAARLPKFVRLRDDTRIESGKFTISIKCAPAAGGAKRRWDGMLAAGEVVATAAGRRIEYRQPFRIELSAEAAPGEAPNGQMRCVSDYLTVEAEGSGSDASISVRGDLARLSADLRQLVNLGGVKLAGRIDAGFQIGRRRSRAEQSPAPEAIGLTAFEANGHVLTEDLLVELPIDGMRPFREPRLALGVQIAGALDGARLVRLDEAQVRVDSGGDHLLATLKEAVISPSADSHWPLNMTIEGDIATWLARLQPWVVLPRTEIAGALRASSSGSFSARRCQVDKLHIQLQSFRLHSGTLMIDEPRIEVEAIVEFDEAARRLAVPSLTMATSSLSLRASRVLCQLDPQAPMAGGDLAFRGDLARLSRWLGGAAPPAAQFSGMVVGRAELREAAGVITAAVTAEIENFAASVLSGANDRLAGPVTRPTSAAGWQQVWSEPRIAVTGTATYRPSTEQLDLARLEITSNVLQLANVQGRIAELGTRKRIDLSGQLKYDLARIMPLVSSYVGQGVQMIGRGERDFALRGPLSALSTSGSDSAGGDLADLSGHAGIGFDRAEFFGLTTGPGEIKAELKQSVVQFAPLQLAVSQGRLFAAPRIELTPAALLVHDRGRIVENVELTPIICQNWMKYVAPLLADAARADGRFSLDLAGCRVPLSDTSKSDIAGTLSIHAARVRPGPVAEPLVLIARQVEALVQKKSLPALLGSAAAGGGDVQLNIESQNVDFQVRDGRVTHSRFKIVVGDVEVRTFGSVGFDQSLAITAEVPILAKWVEREPALKGMAGKTLQIPVGGTLSQPVIDRRGYDALARQIGTAAVGGVIEDAIGKGLEGLLKKKK